MLAQGKTQRAGPGQINHDSEHGSLQFDKNQESDEGLKVANEQPSTQYLQTQDCRLDLTKSWKGALPLQTMFFSTLLASFKATQFVKMLDGFAIAEDTDFGLTFRDIIAASSPALLAVIDQYSTGVTSFADNATIVRSSIAFNETINAFGDNDFIYMGDGALSVLNSTGENTFVVGGRFGKNIINLAGGNNRVYLRSPGTSIEQIDVLGADADVHFGPGTTLIVEGQGNGKFFFDQGDGALTVRGGAVDLSQSHKVLTAV